MALTNTDLLLVQRGTTPHKSEASVLATYIKSEVKFTKNVFYFFLGS